MVWFDNEQKRIDGLLEQICGTLSKMTLNYSKLSLLQTDWRILGWPQENLAQIRDKRQGSGEYEQEKVRHILGLSAASDS